MKRWRSMVVAGARHGSWVDLLKMALFDACGRDNIFTYGRMPKQSAAMNQM